ncbi:MAG: alpha/beta hydrolase [Alphaproteobacteria bacterium]|nr:alpha/beta hydrolase [Alphaproteobacteria bacterium]
MASFPQPVMIPTNGIEMAVHQAGPDNGLPVVLLHGFPELAYSWRHQLPALAQIGCRVLAPDQRGYGLTSRPPGMDQYDMAHLTDDLMGLLGALEIDEAVFCGHDWGGAVAWSMALLHPEVVRAVISLNTPLIPHMPVDPLTTLRTIYGSDNYMLQFQKPGEADGILARDVARTFRFFMRKNAITQSEFSAAPPEMKALNLFGSFAREEAHWRGEPLLEPDEMKVYVDTFKRTGFTGGLNWYRNMLRNWQQMDNVKQKVAAPSLMIMAEDDFILRPSMADGMEAYVPDLEKVLIRSCGHWTQQENPHRTNAIMTDWLKRRFL